jgi:hypothetical protein
MTSCRSLVGAVAAGALAVCAVAEAVASSAMKMVMADVVGSSLQFLILYTDIG